MSLSSPLSGSLSRSLSVAITGGAIVSDVSQTGGNVRDGESFSVYYAPGGLTGATSVTINDIACTGVSVVDDQNLTATAPSDDLLHGTAYTMEIS